MDSVIHGPNYSAALPRPAGKPALKRKIGTGFNRRTASGSTDTSQPAQAATAPQHAPQQAAELDSPAPWLPRAETGEQQEPSGDSQQTCSAPVPEHSEPPASHMRPVQPPADHGDSRWQADAPGSRCALEQQLPSPCRGVSVADADLTAPGNAFEDDADIGFDDVDALDTGAADEAPLQVKPESRCCSCMWWIAQLLPRLRAKLACGQGHVSKEGLKHSQAAQGHRPAEAHVHPWGAWAGHGWR